MLQLKPIDQLHYKVYSDREYLIVMQFGGKAELYVCDGIKDYQYETHKHYTYLHTYSSLDSLLHCLYERGVSI